MSAKVIDNRRYDQWFEPNPLLNFDFRGASLALCNSIRKKHEAS